MNKNQSRRSAALSLGFLLFAVVVLAVNLRAPLVALGPVVGFIRDELGVSGSFMGMVAALPLLAFALFSPLAAQLAKRFGMENVLIGSIVLMMAGIALRSAYPSATLLVWGTIILSAAIAMGNVLLPALAKRNLPTRVGLVVGTLSAAMSVSATLAAAWAVPLAQWQNWRWSLGVWWLFAAFALVIWCLARKNLRTNAVETPPQRSDGLNVWRSPTAWCISAFMGIQSLMFYSVVSFLPSVLVEKGMTALAAGGYSSLLQVASLVGALSITALLGKTYKTQQVILAAALILTVGIAGIWVGNQANMWLWVVCTGFGASAVFSAALMLFAMRTDSPQQAASLSGMAQAVGYLIAVAGPLGMGVLYDVFGSWSASMGVLTGLMAIECLLAWFAANPKTLAQMQRHT